MSTLRKNDFSEKLNVIHLLTGKFRNGKVPEKIHTPPTEEISAVWRRRGEKIVSDNSKYIRTSEGGRGLTSYFLRGGGMDVFWNDPIALPRFKNLIVNM